MTVSSCTSRRYKTHTVEMLPLEVCREVTLLFLSCFTCWSCLHCLNSKNPFWCRYSRLKKKKMSPHIWNGSCSPGTDSLAEGLNITRWKRRSCSQNITALILVGKPMCPSAASSKGAGENFFVCSIWTWQNETWLWWLLDKRHLSTTTTEKTLTKSDAPDILPFAFYPHAT